MRRSAVVGAVVLAGTGWLGAQPSVPPIELFFAAGALDEQTSRAALDALMPSWRDAYTPLIIDMARLLRPVARTVEDVGAAEFAGRVEPDADADAGSPGGAPRSDFGASMRRPPTPESLVRGRPAAVSREAHWQTVRPATARVAAVDVESAR